MAKRRFGLIGMLSLGLTTLTASAQAPYFVHPPKQPCPPQWVSPPAQMAPIPTQPQAQQPPQATPPTPPPQQQQAPQTQPQTQPEAPTAPDVDLGGGLALGESTVALAMPGYIDNPVVMNRIRLRYDSMRDNPVPDRGEFFYPKCGCFANPAAGQQFDPEAKGPPLPETGVDAQEAELMIERVVSCRASLFLETPFRWIDPERNADESGIGDVKVGVKFAIVQDERTALTAQLRVGFPTGDGRKGLGNELYSFEPALLLTRQIGCKSYLHGEVRGWIPTEGSDFAADIVRYGAGYSYLLVDSCSYRVLPVAELVGWTLLNGLKSGPLGAEDATRDTIVNAKLGVRIGMGEKLALGQNRSQLYVGYGRAISDDRWYEDIVRAEYQLNY